MPFRTWLLMLVLPIGLTADAGAQRPDDARRGAGARGGVWQVEQMVGQPRMRRGPALEGFAQRGLDARLAVESSVGFWSGRTPRLQETTGTIVDTDSYIVPLMTALKVYPATTPEARFEPFLAAGFGFALGLAREGENAIGGGGTSIFTGFGFKGLAGIELQLSTVLGLTASTRYQWLRFGEEIAGLSTYRGVGFEGGITYRLVY